MRATPVPIATEKGGWVDPLRAAPLFWRLAPTRTLYEQSSAHVTFVRHDTIELLVIPGPSPERSQCLPWSPSSGSLWPRAAWGHCYETANVANLPRSWQPMC